MYKLQHGDFLKIDDNLIDRPDLIFVDPPFNIGYHYDVYKDDKTEDEYLRWCQTWMQRCYYLLKDTGTFWLAIGDEQAAELVCMAKRIGFHMRSWCVWHYTFGVHLKSKFGRGHTHLVYFTKHKKKFTWNPDSIRVPSKRQLMGDKRADPRGRVPDDVWQFSRICGTFKERTSHSCQMPEKVLERIILACSNPGDLVLDPMAGSGTTLVVAEKTGRNSQGVELSQDYCDIIKSRMLEHWKSTHEQEIFGKDN